MGPGICFGVTYVVVCEGKEIFFLAKAYKTDWSSKVSMDELEESCGLFLWFVWVVDFVGLRMLATIADVSR